MTQSDSCILAIDAGGTSLKGALIPEYRNAADCAALTGRTFFSVAVQSGGTRDDILNTYRILGRKGALLADDAKLSIRRAAVSIPGPFDYANGCSLMKHKYQAVYGIPLGPHIQEGIGRACPITFLHDSTAFLLGAVLSLPAKKRRLCGVTIGTGLGFACMTDGKVLQNSSGGPAVSIYASAYLDGIAEDYVSKRGILRRYQEKTGMSGRQLPTVCRIAEIARDGDSAALKVFADTGFHLGQILLPVLREYRFDTVLLGGAISKSAALFLPQLNQVIAAAGALALPAAEIDLAPLSGAAQYTDARIRVKF